MRATVKNRYVNAPHSNSISIAIYTLQTYSRLNHLNLCVSYNAILKLMDDLSLNHSVPLQKWIEQGVVFKFWGDNVDKQRRVCDLRSNNTGQMVHMFSILVGRSRTPAPELLHIGGEISVLDRLSTQSFFPSISDVGEVKENLVTIISRVLTRYITSLVPFAKIVQQHIHHQYSAEMAQKSEVYALDILMKNEARHADMIDIMRTLQGYLGKDYNSERRVPTPRTLLCITTNNSADIELSLSISPLSRVTVNN